MHFQEFIPVILYLHADLSRQIQKNIHIASIHVINNYENKKKINENIFV